MSSTHSGNATEARARNRGLTIVLALCWVFVLLDGLDLFVYSAVMPTILKNGTLGITPSLAGDIGSYTTFGMLIGALCAGTVTDWIGRKKTIISAVTLFSLASLLVATAQSSTAFGAWRFVAGLGLGGLLPIAISYAMDYAPPTRRNIMVGAVMTAHQAGGMLAAGVGLWAVPSLGWRSAFWIGAIPFVIVVPLAVKYLPESLSFLVAKGRVAEAEALAGKHGLALPELPSPGGASDGSRAGNLRALFVHPQWRTTLAFWCTSFAGLLLIYGVATWLPSMMRESGYDLGSAVSFLMVINLGGIVGLLGAGRLSDRLGSIPVTIAWFAMTAVGVGLLAVRMPLALTYIVVFLTGTLLFSAQTMLYATVGGHHGPESRATAVGWVAGVGRFGAVFGPWLGGVLVSAHAAKWGFGVYSIAGIVGALGMTLAALSIRAQAKHATAHEAPVPTPAVS